MILLFNKLVNVKVAITEMYARIPWELVVDPLGTLGTTGTDKQKEMWGGVGYLSWSTAWFLQSHIFVRSFSASLLTSYNTEDGGSRFFPNAGTYVNKNAWHHHMPKDPLKIVPTSKKPQRLHDKDQSVNTADSENHIKRRIPSVKFHGVIPLSCY